jgi:hypothetical protein
MMGLVKMMRVGVSASVSWRAFQFGAVLLCG